MKPTKDGGINSGGKNNMTIYLKSYFDMTSPTTPSKAPLFSSPYPLPTSTLPGPIHT